MAWCSLDKHSLNKFCLHKHGLISFYWMFWLMNSFQDILTTGWRDNWLRVIKKILSFFSFWLGLHNTRISPPSLLPWVASSFLFSLPLFMCELWGKRFSPMSYRAFWCHIILIFTLKGKQTRIYHVIFMILIQLQYQLSAVIVDQNGHAEKYHKLLKFFQQSPNGSSLQRDFRLPYLCSQKLLNNFCCFFKKPGFTWPVYSSLNINSWVYDKDDIS